MRNEKGIALVLVMMLSLMGLAIVAALLFMVTQSTSMSGYHRVFRSAEDAGLGGAQIATEFIKNGVSVAVNGNTFDGTSLPLITNLSITNISPCVGTKLTTNTGSWVLSATCSKTLDASDTPDFQYRLQDTLFGYDYTVYTKIVDTVQGNTDSGGLKPGALVGPGVVDVTGRTSPAANPTLYRFEVQAQATANPTEVSRYSVLYAY